MIKECKRCGGKNLYLEPRIKGQDVMTADIVALKCEDCGAWLKWCPKNERVKYIKNTQAFEHIINQYKPAFCVFAGDDCEYMEIKERWNTLKEWLTEKLYILKQEQKARKYSELLQIILNKMKELEQKERNSNEP